MSKKSPDPIEVRVLINDVPGAGQLWIKEMAKYLVEKSLCKEKESD